MKNQKKGTIPSAKSRLFSALSFESRIAWAIGLKNQKKFLALALSAVLFISLFTGCEFFGGLLDKINGESDSYTLTKGFTYTESAEPTEVYFVHTGETDSGIKYKLYSSYVEITGYNGRETDLTIPEILEDTCVTVIAENAFANSAITSIKLPDSVVEICPSAFYECESLLEASLGDGVAVIGRYSFFGCKNLITVNLGSGLRTIDKYAFNSCYALQSIVFPDGLQSIGDHAFYLCRDMFKVFIPYSVKSFGNDIFKSTSANFKIYAPTGSEAELYANANSILYVQCDSYLEESFNSDIKYPYPDAEEFEEFEEEGSQENPDLSDNNN